MRLTKYFIRLFELDISNLQNFPCPFSQSQGEVIVVPEN